MVNFLLCLKFWEGERYITIGRIYGLPTPRIPSMQVCPHRKA
jgi:hypothetical protein